MDPFVGSEPDVQNQHAELAPQLITESHYLDPAMYLYQAPYGLYWMVFGVSERVVGGGGN